MSDLENSIYRASSVSWENLDALIAQANRDGVDTANILERHQVPTTRKYRDSHRLDLIDYFKVERDIARSLDDLTAHLSTRKLTYKTGDFVVQQLGSSATLADAICKLSDYFNMMHGGEYNTVRTSEKTISISIDDRDFPYTMTNQPDLVSFTGECVQIKVHCLLDSLSHGLAAKALQKVSVTRQANMSGAEHLAFWVRKPLFQQDVYALTYNLSIAQQKIPYPAKLDLSSAGILSQVISHLEETAHTHLEMSTLERVTALLVEGHTDQDEIAERLNISVATLRRRLSESGVTFRELLQQHRIKAAENLLARGKSITQITDMLGYSDIRAFNRAFKRWKGMTPFEYSRQIKSCA